MQQVCNDKNNANDDDINIFNIKGKAKEETSGKSYVRRSHQLTIDNGARLPRRPQASQPEEAR